MGWGITWWRIEREDTDALNTHSKASTAMTVGWPSFCGSGSPKRHCM